LTLIPAKLWKKGEKDELICLLCARVCHLKDGDRGFCQVRINVNGELFTLNYGYMNAVSLDPVEKKPLYHFLPESQTFSIGAPGCNFSCLGCQNYNLSRPGDNYPGIAGNIANPEGLVNAALSTDAKSFSFTYSEPTVFYEYAFDTGKLALLNGLPSIWVTNGFLSYKTLETLDHVKAMNIDLKGFTEDFYKKVTFGRLGPVKDTIRNAYQKGIWVELTTLLIPDLNNSDKELKELTEFIASVSPDIPWHISRFMPLYKQSHLKMTSREDLLKASEIGKKNGLKYVYIGNMEGKGFGDTLCPKCGTILVGRNGFSVRQNLLKKDGHCPKCGIVIPGVWS
jgi:pyruvate formate lyase activating enzyme